MKIITYEEGVSWTDEEHRRLIDAIVRRTGLTPLKVLGYGSQGAVLETDDPSKVIKVTTHSSEGLIANSIWKSGLDKMPGCVEIYDAFRILQQVDPARRVIAIVREPITPLKAFFIFSRTFDEAVSLKDLALRQFGNSINQYENIILGVYLIARESIRIDETKRLSKLLEHLETMREETWNLKDVYPGGKPIGDEFSDYFVLDDPIRPLTDLCDFLKACSLEGIFLRDVGLHNLGLRTREGGNAYQFVLYDVGVGRGKEGVTQPEGAVELRGIDEVWM
jgi:hypothetical protein